MAIPSSRLLNRLKLSEGFRAEPYVCPAGYATIGYGHNLEAHPAPIRQWSTEIYKTVAAGGLHGKSLTDKLRALGMAWDKDHAQEWLRTDVIHTAERLTSACRVYCQLIKQGDEERAEVLLDMAFNLGVGGLLGFRNMLLAVEEGDYSQAAAHMLDSLWARQVGKRAEDLSRTMREGTI